MPESLSTLHTDVLVVGAGPTGLMAANQLNRFNIDFLIIDGKSGPTEESRAIAVTARSLEIYEQMGLIDKVLAGGQRIHSFHFFNRGKERGVVQLGEIGKGYSDFNYMLAFEQNKNEKMLVEHLAANGKEVMWETAFASMQVNNGETVITATTYAGNIHIHAKYVIACDGASSPVRHFLKMKFEGGTYENKFFVADTILKWDLEYDSLVISPAYENFVAFFPMTGQSNYRVLGTLPDEASGNPVTFNDIQKVILETIGIPVTFEKVNWFSVYKLHHRRVECFRKGNVFVAGDAAHIHSPAGGQGMNTGLQDAYNLAWKLAYVLKGWAKPGILDTYNEERLPFAKWLMSFTDRGFNVMTSDNPLLAFVRTYFASNIVGLFINRKLLRQIAFKTVSQISYSYRDMSLSKGNTELRVNFKAGDRIPYVMDSTGERSIYHLFTRPGFHLLHIGAFGWDEDAIKKISNIVPFPLHYVRMDLLSWNRYGVKKETFVVIRPDNYILWIGAVMNVNVLMEIFSEFFQIKKQIT